jgi:hypothetical protein
MAADDSSDSAGIGVFPVREGEPADPQQSAIYFDASLETWRGWDGADWVEFAGKLHNSLPDLQGGAAGEYYHLTEDEHGALTGHGFPPTAVIYADADGHIAGDAAKFAWTGSQLLLNAGAAATPAIARVGYADDGIYWPADGQMAVALGGSAYAWLSGAGYASFGTGARPGSVSYPFEVRHTIVGRQNIHFENYSADAAAGVRLHLQTGGGHDTWLLFQFAGNYYSFGADASSSKLKFGVSSAFDEAANDRMSLDSNGQFALPDGTAGAPSYSFLSDLDTGWFSPGANMMGLGLAGTERLRITDSGTKVTLSRP